MMKQIEMEDEIITSQGKNLLRKKAAATSAAMLLVGQSTYVILCLR